MKMGILMQKIYLAGLIGLVFMMVADANHAIANQHDSEPVDLTDLIKPADDGDDPKTSQASESPSAKKESTGGLTRRDVGSIRLGNLGLERSDVDGLGRLMWRGSRAGDIVNLNSALVDLDAPHVLEPIIHHVVVAQAVPPEGFGDVAEQLINTRLEWLAAQGLSEDLAELIRPLPDDEAWESWKEWLVLHDLLTRNDEAACQEAERKAGLAFERLWHQVNAFCAVLAGDSAKASFALDILEDSGVDDGVYFALMRQLVAGQEIDLGGIDQDDLSMLNLAMMDSARVRISAQAVLGVPSSYRQTIQSLRHLSPDASRLLSAWYFGQHRSVDELTASWALTPSVDVDVAESLKQLRLGGDADQIALVRLNLWQAIGAEQADSVQAELALQALGADYRHGGSLALELWLGFIEGGANDLQFEDKIGALLGFADEPSKILLNEGALAWHEMLQFATSPLSAEHINKAQAHDAIDLLAAGGRAVENQDWLNEDLATEATARLSGGESLPYWGVKSVEAAATNGLKAETLLRVAVLLGGVELASLTRDDATRLTASLYQVGLTQTAQALARDILKAWGLERHFRGQDPKPQEIKSQDQATEGQS